MSISRIETEIEKCLERIRERVKRFEERARQLAQELERFGAVYTAKSCGPPQRVAGLDSSMAIASPHPSTRIAIVKASLIESSASGSRVLKDVFRVEVVEAPRRVVDDVVEDLMLALESSLLSERIEGMLLIDGPVVDPPRPQSPHSTTLLRSAVGEENLHAYRAHRIAELLSRGVDVVGFVKRIEGVGSDGELLEPILFRALRILEQKLGSRVYIAADLEREHPEAVKHYREAGIDIVHVYALYGARAIRIDVACLSRCSLDRCSEVVERVLSLPSLNGVPLPVALAHERCRVGRDVVEVVERCIARRILAIDPHAIDVLGR